jgi:hypothetical protein
MIHVFGVAAANPMSSRTLPVRVAILALLSMAAAGAHADSPALERARSSLDAEDWSASAEAYREIARADPESGPAWSGLAAALFGAGEHGAAVDALERALALEYEVEQTTFELARVHAASGEPGRALERLEELARVGSTARLRLANAAEFDSMRGSPEFDRVLHALRPCRAAEYRQFDFWLGEWNVTNAAAPQRPATRNRITATQDGCAVLEEYETPSGYSGVSVSYYDAATESWNQTWIDNQGRPIVHSGGLDDGRMILVDSPTGDRPLDRTTWSQLKDGRVRQHWERSADGGESWDTVFDGYYVRAGDSRRIDGRPPTDNASLRRDLERIVDDLAGNPGDWTFMYAGVRMRLITDEEYDRMRIFAPITDLENLEEDQVMAMLHANFDRALDAKYALWQGGAWSIFTHPLADLSRDQLIDAVRQVASLVHTFGNGYSSMDIGFGGG